MLSPINIAKMLQYWGTPFVTIMYRCFLNREPDSDGLKYYLGRLEQGYDRLTIIEQILKSSEAKAHYNHKEISIIQLEIKRLKSITIAGYLPVVRNFSNSLPKSQRILMNRLSELQFQISPQDIPEKKDFFGEKILPIYKIISINKNSALKSLNNEEQALFKKIFKQL